MERIKENPIRNKNTKGGKMNNFNSGDIVYLKTGSPAMTVKDSVNVDDNPNECIVQCTWFEGTKLFEHEFRFEQLTNKDPKQIPPSSAITMG